MGWREWVSAGRQWLVVQLHERGWATVMKLEVESDTDTVWYLSVVHVPGLTKMLAAYAAGYAAAERVMERWGGMELATAVPLRP